MKPIENNLAALTAALEVEQRRVAQEGANQLRKKLDLRPEEYQAEMLNALDLAIQFTGRNDRYLFIYQETTHTFELSFREQFC